MEERKRFALKRREREIATLRQKVQERASLLDQLEAQSLSVLKRRGWEPSPHKICVEQRSM